MQKASFAEFYILWDKYLKRKTPLFHIEVCDWMENLSEEVDNLLMLPRGHNKSGIVVVFNAWRYYRDKDDLILHQGANDPDAEKCSNGVQYVLENHPLCQATGIKKRDGGIRRWWVEGANDTRYGSMYARGILSTVTGQRATHIQNDDVEVPSNVNTPENIEKLKFRLQEQPFILVPGGTTLFIGTPHSHDSIYKEMQESKANCFIRRMFSKERRIRDTQEALLDFYPEYVFSGIHKFSRCLEEGVDFTVSKINKLYHIKINEKFGVVDLYADALWPERFTKQEMTKRRKKCRTLNAWDSQYQLHAKPITNVRLDPDKMIPYDCEPVLRRANGSYIMMLGGRQIVGMTMRWDPSSGKTKSDISNVALVLHDDFGTKYWHRSLALTDNVIEHDDQGNIIGGQVWQLCDLIEEFNVPRITIETNGPGTFAPPALKGALKKRRIRCGVAEVHNSIAKNKRILEALEGPLLSGLLWVHTSVVDTPEEGENSSPAYKKMRMFNPAITNQPDDELDSLAGAITDSPERVGKIHNGLEPNESPNWRTDGGVTDAALDFEEY